MSNTQLKAISAMNKLYIGNLPMEVDEASVRQLFSEHSLCVADISVKRGGYAFVDFLDQSAADRAIDKLHGYTYCGLPLVVEPSVANKKMSGAVSAHDSTSATQLHDEDAGCEMPAAGDGGGGGCGARSGADRATAAARRSSRFLRNMGRQ